MLHKCLCNIRFSNFYLFTFFLYWMIISIIYRLVVPQRSIVRIFSFIYLRNGGGAPPAFHILANDMSLNRGATHFTPGLRPCIISILPNTNLAAPPLKFTQLRPCFFNFDNCINFSDCADRGFTALFLSTSTTQSRLSPNS